MYYLIIDIQHLGQLRRVETEKLKSVLKGLSSICSQQGLQAHEPGDELLFFHPHLAAGEYEPLLKALFQARDLLDQQLETISGYAIIIEASNEDRINNSYVDGLKFRTRERSGMYLGPVAQTLIGRFLHGEPMNGLWRVERRKLRDDENLGTATEFCFRPELYEPLFDALEPWMNGERLPGLVCISGTEAQGIHLVGRGLAQRLGSNESRGKMPFCVLGPEQDLVYSLVQAISVRNLGWVEEYLSAAEAGIWAHCRSTLQSVHPFSQAGSSRYDLLPERLTDDMTVAFKLYVTVFARWSRERGNLPLLVLHLRRSLNEAESSFLERLMEDLQEDARVYWLFTGKEAFMPSGTVPIERWNSKIPLLQRQQLEQAIPHFTGMATGEAEPVDYSAELNALLSTCNFQPMLCFLYLIDLDFFSRLSSSRLASLTETNGEPRSALVIRFLERLDDESRVVLYVLKLCGDYFDKEQLFEFLEVLGYQRIRITELFKNLQSRGLLFSEDITTVPFAAEIEQISYGLSIERGRIARELIDFIVQRSPDAGSQFAAIPGLLSAVFRNSGQAETTQWAYRRVQMFVQSRQFAIANALMPDIQRMPDGQQAIRLLDIQIQSMSKNSDAPNLYPERFTSGFWKGEAHLMLCYAHCRNGNVEACRLEAKQAIIEFQQTQDSYGLSSANTAFGYSLLCQSKHQDAIHYFSIGERRNERRIRDAAGIAAEFLPSISDFSQGKLSRVRSVLEGPDGMIERLHRNGAVSRAAFAVFLLGRCYFALGLFHRAQAILSAQLNSMGAPEFESMRRIYRSWIARNLIYSGGMAEGLRILEDETGNLEAQVFRAEGMILQGEFDRAREILSHQQMNPDSDKRYSPFLPLNSGYSWIEDIYIWENQSQAVLATYALAIEAYALGSTDQSQKAVEKFHWLTRERKLAPSDPHVSVILYWYSQIVEHTQEGEGEDRLTLLGRAVKSLQERSSRITEPADKREYLKNVVWNRDLLDKAKRFNLV